MQCQCMVVWLECLPVPAAADTPWGVVSATRRSSSGVAPRACVRACTRVLLVPPNMNNM